MPDVDELLGTLTRITTDLEGHIERRAAAIAGPRIAEVEARTAAAVAEVVEERDLLQRRLDDVLAEVRRRIASLERQNQRYMAQLRTSGLPQFFSERAARDLPGDPPATEPATQILTWLDAIMPAWPEDQELGASVTCYRAPFGARTAVDFECHPGPSSRNIPLGALIRALQAVARHDPHASALDVVFAVRNVLAGHRVAEIADGLAAADRAEAELANRTGHA